jgi:hypothetical protein
MLRGITFAQGALLVAMAGLLAVAIDVAMSRAELPQTACSVSDAQYRTLPLRVNYERAKSLFGCDGGLVTREALGPNSVYEAYAWRGAGWPNSQVTAEFFGNTLERKSIRSSLSVVYQTSHAEFSDDWRAKQALREISRHR